MKTNRILSGLLLALLPAMVQAQDLPVVVPTPWAFTTANTEITIIKYTGPGGAVTIPGQLNGQPVVTIGPEAFWGCTNLTSVTVPPSVSHIGDFAFGKCNNLQGVYFMSAAPYLGTSIFFEADQVVVYILPGTAGWAQYYGGRPTARWVEADQSDASGGKASH